MSFRVSEVAILTLFLCVCIISVQSDSFDIVINLLHSEHVRKVPMLGNDVHVDHKEPHRRQSLSVDHK